MVSQGSQVSVKMKRSAGGSGVRSFNDRFRQRVCKIENNLLKYINNNCKEICNGPM